MVKENTAEITDAELVAEGFDIARQWLRAYPELRTKTPRFGSYGLKHIIERAVSPRHYVSQDALLAACRAEGVVVKGREVGISTRVAQMDIDWQNGYAPGTRWRHVWPPRASSQKDLPHPFKLEVAL